MKKVDAKNQQDEPVKLSSYNWKLTVKVAFWLYPSIMLNLLIQKLIFSFPFLTARNNKI